MSQLTNNVRINKSEKDIIKTLKQKSKILGGNLREADIIKVALGLVEEKHLKVEISTKRKGRDRKTILKNEWFRKNPKKTLDDFEDFTLTPEWIEFVKTNRQLLGAV